ncbi:MAG TPA: YIP1 family protein [Gemmatimonadales bacterium]|nr:YIP1 family protein [Gemmatimonadales bacterium]
MAAVLDLIRVLFEPTAVFERVREKPRFLAPFLALAVLAVVIGVVQLPYTQAAISAQMAQTPNVTPQQAEAALKFAPIGLALAPIFYGVFLLLSALILWVSVSVLGGEAKFATLLSVTTYTSITYTLLQVVGVAVLMMRGTSAITGTVDLQPSLGLDLLAPDAKGFALAALRGVNPFTLYGLYLTSVGIVVTHQTSKTTAYAAAAIQFVIALTIGAALSRG